MRTKKRAPSLTQPRPPDSGGTWRSRNKTGPVELLFAYLEMQGVTAVSLARQLGWASSMLSHLRMNGVDEKSGLLKDGAKAEALARAAMSHVPALGCTQEELVRFLHQGYPLLQARIWDALRKGLHPLKLIRWATDRRASEFAKTLGISRALLHRHEGRPPSDPTTQEYVQAARRYYQRQLPPKV